MRRWMGNVELLSEGLVAFVASDTRDNWQAEHPHLRGFREYYGREPIGREAPLVSTFSSFEEQGALARRLEEKLPFVWVDPAGIKANLPARVKAACEEGWGSSSRRLRAARGSISSAQSGVTAGCSRSPSESTSVRSRRVGRSTPYFRGIGTEADAPR